MSEGKVGSLGIIIVVLVLCIAGSVGATYFLVGQIKQSEIDNLKNQHEAEISDLSSQIENLQNTLNVDNPNYIKQMTKGLQMYSSGDYYEGTAISDNIDANNYYETQDYSLASTHALYASWAYDWASDNYSKAKPFFQEAEKYAPNNNALKLAQLFANLTEFSAQKNSELSDAYEDFSTACDYYYNNNYDMGGLYIDNMNEHIEDSNSYFESYDDCLTDIDNLLEIFLLE